MRLPIYLICAALVLAIEAEENGVDYYGSLVELMNQPEREQFNYLVPKMTTKYKPEMERLTNSGYYLIPNDINTDTERLGAYNRLRKRQYESFVGDVNGQPSLSIKAPIDVLRKAMYQRNLQRQAERNRLLLNSL